MEKINIVGLDEVIYKQTLKNGLTIYMWPNYIEKHISASLVVKYGSIHTNYKVGNKTYNHPNGVAHFLEHLKFNLTNGERAEDLFNKLGTKFNAYTTFDHTNYFINFRDKLDQNINHLLNYVYDGHFTKELVEKEKGIIIEEEKMGDDNVERRMIFGINELLFHQKGYKTSITGDEEDIKNITVTNIKDVFKHFYHPKNMFLVVTGHFNKEEMLNTIEKCMENKKFSKYNKPILNLGKEQDEVYKEYAEEFKEVGIPRARIAIKINKNTLTEFNDIEKFEYLNLLINSNFSSTSELNYSFRKKNIGQIKGSYIDYYNNYLIANVYIEAHNIKRGVKLVKKRLNNLKLTKKDFVRKKKAKTASIITDYENYERVGNKIIYELLTFNKIINNTKTLTEKSSYEQALKFKSQLKTNNMSIFVIHEQEKSSL